MPTITSGMDYKTGGGGTWKVRPSLGLNAPLTTAELKESLKTLPVGSAYSGDIWRQAREYEEMQEGKKTALDDLGNVYQQGISSYSEAANAATQEAIGNIEKRYADQEQMLIQNAQRQGVGMTQLQNPNSPLSKLRAQKTAEINAEKSKTVRDIANMTNMLNLEYGKTKYAQTTGQKAEDFALKNQRMQTGIAADEEQRTQERAQARQDEMLDKVSQMQGGGAGGQAPVEGRQETGAMFTDEQGQPILDSRQMNDMTTQWEKGVEEVNASVEKTAAAYGYGDAQKKNLTIKRMNDLAKKLKSQYDLPQSVEEIAQQMQEVGYQKEKGRAVTNSLGKLARGSELTEDERNSLIDSVGPEAVLKAEQAGSDEERQNAIFDIQKQQGLLNIQVSTETLSQLKTKFGWEKEDMERAKAQEINNVAAQNALAEQYADLFKEETQGTPKEKGRMTGTAEEIKAEEMKGTGADTALLLIKGMGTANAVNYFERLRDGKVMEAEKKKQEEIARVTQEKQEAGMAVIKKQLVASGLNKEDIDALPAEVLGDIWSREVSNELESKKNKELTARTIKNQDIMSKISQLEKLVLDTQTELANAQGMLTTATTKAERDVATSKIKTAQNTLDAYLGQKKQEILKLEIPQW